MFVSVPFSSKMGTPPKTVAMQHHCTAVQTNRTKKPVGILILAPLLAPADFLIQGLSSFLFVVVVYFTPWHDSITDSINHWQSLHTRTQQQHSLAQQTPKDWTGKKRRRSATLGGGQRSTVIITAIVHRNRWELEKKTVVACFCSNDLAHAAR